MPDTDIMRFNELLPFYVNGTLDTDERDFVEAYLEKNPAAKDDLKFGNLMAEAIRLEADERAADAGLEKALTRFRGAHLHRNWLGRFKLACREWGLTPAFALAATLLFVQTGILIRQQAILESPQYRSVVVPKTPTYQLKIIPSPKASFAEVTLLLRQQGCTIVAGPSETGEIWVTTDGMTPLDNIRKTLIASPLVDEAVVMP